MKAIVRSIPLIELTMILAVAVLEYLSDYHAGIMHHLYYKKRVYLTTYFSGQVLWLHLLPVGASLTAATWAFRRRHAPAASIPIRYITVFLALLLTATLPWLQQLNTSVHLFFVLEICLMLEVLRMVLLARSHIL